PPPVFLCSVMLFQRHQPLFPLTELGRFEYDGSIRRGVIEKVAFFLQAFTSRLTRKYLLIFSLILIIPTIIIYRLIVSYAQNVMEENISRDNLIGADAIVKRLNAEITDVVLLLQLIAGQNL